MNNKIYNIWKNTKYYSVKHGNYFDIYQKIFSKYINKKITFVEIGILAGGSLFMWREFFGKDARIIGIDINPNANKWKKEGFEIYIGDAGSKEFWKDFFNEVGNVDIVLDDGSHLYPDQIVTASECIPHINNDGKMVTEDVHSSYQKRYGYPSKFNFINFSRLLIDQINYRFPDLEKKERNATLHLRKKIYSITFYESIISFNINEEKCMENTMVKNGGIIDDATHGFNYLEKSTIKKILVFFAKKLSFLKKYKILLFFVKKFDDFLDQRLRKKNNKTSKKYFK